MYRISKFASSGSSFLCSRDVPPCHKAARNFSADVYKTADGSNETDDNVPDFTRSGRR